MHLKSYFPFAQITKVLSCPGEPLAVATLDDDLLLHGERFVGRIVLGMRPSISADGELLVSEHPSLPHHVDAATGWTSLGPAYRRTDIWVEGRGGSHHFPTFFLRESVS